MYALGEIEGGEVRDLTLESAEFTSFSVTYPVAMENTEISFEPQSSFIRGDCNGSLSVTITDSLFLLEWIFAGGEVPLPSFWGGYRVRADSFEFWQGRPARLHDRFLYTRMQGGGWRVERLAP